MNANSRVQIAHLAEKNSYQICSDDEFNFFLI